jgi:hypothetical protein
MTHRLYGQYPLQDVRFEAKNELKSKFEVFWNYNSKYWYCKSQSEFEKAQNWVDNYNKNTPKSYSKPKFEGKKKLQNNGRWMTDAEYDFNEDNNPMDNW